MSKITWHSFRVADRVKKLGTDDAPIRAIPGKPRSAWREGRVGGAMSVIWHLASFRRDAEFGPLSARIGHRLAIKLDCGYAR